MTSQSTTYPLAGFSTEFNRFVKRCRDSGIDFSGMQRAHAVEMSLGEAASPQSTRFAGEDQILRIEGPIEARKIPKSASASKLRYFLDGAQQTLPAGRLGHVPAYLSITSAGIVERDDNGTCTLVPGTLKIQSCWLVPEGIDSDHTRFICDGLREMGIAIVDPLASYAGNRERYLRAASDYVHIESQALAATNHERSKLEEDLLGQWERTLSDGEQWIVVDGQLRRPVANAVGLVKAFTYQYVTGDEATALFSLPAGQRSSAFIAENQYRSEPKERALWYLRFHNSEGLDARHGLIRLEAAPDVVDSDRIDELSAWLLAERAPRASSDARWDSLIYPIHLLERMLKRKLSEVTLAWPGARR